MATSLAALTLEAMTEHSEPSLKVEEGPVRGAITVVLNRAQRKNALTRELVLALGRELHRLAQDPTCKVIVLRGSGGAFCSGADLSTISSPEAQEDIEGRIDEFHQLITGIVRAPQPVIAVVDGPAVGFGADLALACDMRAFTEDGYIEEGFIKIGLMPDGGGTYFMPRFAGPLAFEYLTLGTRLTATRCAQLGIANEVVSKQDTDALILRWTTAFTHAAPLALRSIKFAVRQNEMAALDRALHTEKAGQTQLVRSEDFQEGVRAFLAKGTPQFQGR